MLSKEENELITRIGPGTPMGNTMRRYWIPACLSSEIAEPDGAPVRVKLLGEDLVAFRDTEGRIGLVEEYLPASPRVALFRAQRGMRPALRLSRLEVRRRRHLRRSAERAGGTSVQAQDPPRRLSDRASWAASSGPISGRPSKMPPPPKFAWTQVPEEPPPRHQGHRGMQLAAGARRRHRHLARADPASAADRQLDPRRHQAVEPVRPRQGAEPASSTSPITAISMPASGRSATAEVHVRTYHFIMPFHQIRPSRSESGLPTDAGHIWVPIDDHNCMVYNWIYTHDRCAADRRKTGSNAASATARCMSTRKPSGRCRTGRTITVSTARCRRPRATPASTASTSRTAPCRKAWAGSSTASSEHLGPADKAISQARSCCAKRSRPSKPAGSPAGTGTSYYTVRAGEDVFARDADWHRALAPDITKDKILQTV